LWPSLDETAYLVVDDGVADDDDDARHVVADERHRDDELRVLVRQKLAVAMLGSQHAVADQRIQDHYGRRNPEMTRSVYVKIPTTFVYSIYYLVTGAWPGISFGGGINCGV